MIVAEQRHRLTRGQAGCVLYIDAKKVRIHSKVAGKLFMNNESIRIRPSLLEMMLGTDIPTLHRQFIQEPS